ncbi:pilus assembly protein [Photobacterium makurazakiensis]|uniref:TadE/TadG family type IV pilus assembly protein n=1 Tax=Photobacterium makurazakiensis TaxID=2910234 RepID=UPI003D0B70C0
MSRQLNIETQKGLAIVEATIVLPVLLFLLLIVLDFGRVMYAGVITSSAVRHAAGYGALNPSLSIDYTGMVNAALNDASNLPLNEANTQALTVNASRICRCDNLIAEVDCTTASCSSQLEVYVEVSATRNFNTLISYPFVPSSIQLQRTALVRLQ